MTTAPPQLDTATAAPIAAPAGAAWVDKWELTDDEHIAGRGFHLDELATGGGHTVTVWGEQYVDGTLGELRINITSPDHNNVTLETGTDVEQLIEHLRTARAQCKALRAGGLSADVLPLLRDR